MKKTVRSLVFAGAVLFATTGPVFASISGGDPRPPLPPGGNVVSSAALTAVGL